MVINYFDWIVCIFLLVHEVCFSSIKKYIGESQDSSSISKNALPNGVWKSFEVIQTNGC